MGAVNKSNQLWFSVYQLKEHPNMLGAIMQGSEYWKGVYKKHKRMKLNPSVEAMSDIWHDFAHAANIKAESLGMVVEIANAGADNNNLFAHEWFKCLGIGDVIKRQDGQAWIISEEGFVPLERGLIAP